MRNPLQILDLDMAPSEREEAPAPNPPTPFPTPSGNVWQDRLFDPVGGRIPERMPLMVLRADDPLAVELVRTWARLTEDVYLSIHAGALAEAMEDWQKRHPTRKERGTDDRDIL